MRDFLGSTLWRVSDFERMRSEMDSSGDRVTVFPTTLQAELRVLERSRTGSDPVEVVSICQRQREPALIYLQYTEFVWPVTVFPAAMLYHSPRDIARAPDNGLASLKLLSIEPPGVRPPGHWMHERIAKTDLYRPLIPMLWAMALRGPRKTLLEGIGGTAAYRVLRKPENDGLAATGALGPVVEHLRRQGTSLQHIATLPGMNVDRASRLLNALYLVSNLIVTRAHPAARDEPGATGVVKPKR